jgi:nucleotide-binding universal stress UspA family protein
MTSTTVVGYDGSPTAKAALGYAARRASSAGRLVIAHVIMPPTPFIDTPTSRRHFTGHASAPRNP